MHPAKFTLVDLFKQFKHVKFRTAYELSHFKDSKSKYTKKTEDGRHSSISLIVN